MSRTNLLSEAETAKLLGVTRRVLQTWRHRKQGPSFLKMIGTVRYRRADVEAFAQSCFRPTNETAGAVNTRGDEKELCVP